MPNNPDSVGSARMSGFDLLTATIPVSAAIWFVLAWIPLARGKVRTPSDLAFGLAALLIGWYALLDWVFLSLQDAQVALLVASFRASSLTLAAFFLLLYARWITGERRRGDAVFVLPMLPALGLVWLALHAGAVESPGGLHVLYHPLALAAWILFVSLMIMIALRHFYLGLLAFSQIRERRARRFFWLFLSILMVAGVGLVTNASAAILGSRVFPYFSVFLAVPGAVLLYTQSPAVADRMEESLRRYVIAKHRVLTAFLVNEHGLLIESRRVEDALGLDEDLFVGMLTALQDFMKNSFPLLAHQDLRAVAHGDVTLMVEPGRLSCLVLVVRGEEDDLIRGMMRETVEAFEAKNARALRTWDGTVGKIDCLAFLERFVESAATAAAVPSRDHAGREEIIRPNP